MGLAPHFGIHVCLIPVTKTMKVAFSFSPPSLPPPFRVESVYLKFGDCVWCPQDALRRVRRQLCRLLVLHLSEQLLEALHHLHTIANTSADTHSSLWNAKLFVCGNKSDTRATLPIVIDYSSGPEGGVIRLSLPVPRHQAGSLVWPS